jgi:hypothetical protein
MILRNNMIVLLYTACFLWGAPTMADPGHETVTPCILTFRRIDNIWTASLDPHSLVDPAHWRVAIFAELHLRLAPVQTDGPISEDSETFMLPNTDKPAPLAGTMYGRRIVGISGYTCKVHRWPLNTTPGGRSVSKLNDWQLLQRELERSRAESDALHPNVVSPETQRFLAESDSIPAIPCAPIIGRPLAPQTLVPRNDDEGEIPC